MKGSPDVLVDTSAWIDFFRKKEPAYSCIDRLLDEGNICCLGIILAELLQGAKSEKELEVLRDFLLVFDFLPDDMSLWQKAGELSYSLRRAGKTVGLSDCYIAVSAQTHHVKILSFDRHFKLIDKKRLLKL